MDEKDIATVISLSKVIKDFPEFLKKAFNYFEKNSTPWDVPDNTPLYQVWLPYLPDERDLVEATLQFVESYPLYCKQRWNWSAFITDVMRSEHEYIRWIACRCMSIIMQMTEPQYHELVNIFIPQEKARINSHIAYFTKVFNGDFHISESPVSFWRGENVKPGIVPSIAEMISKYNKTLALFKTDFQSDDIILGEYLNTVQIAVTTGKPICLMGSVGCGKTALVHYVASIVGNSKDLLQVQLGEQMDSKLLLGGYHCTDIPGEFLWQPGVLTRAVLEGRWLLIEDVDLATGDVMAVILSLIEKNWLSVPGYRDNITPAPGFQLFFTQRTVGGFQGYFQHKSSLLEALRKYWVQIDIRKLSQTELLALIQEQFPDLRTISERILDVFSLFSDFSDKNIFLEQLPDNVRNILRANSRLMSMRDLFKWCKRIKLVYKAGDQDSTLKIVQDAIDIFCCNIPNEDIRLIVAGELTARLGVVKTKAEYFCTIYKPMIAVDSGIYKIGRCSLNIKTNPLQEMDPFDTSFNTRYAMTRGAACLMESIACCVDANEPVLLVGETGTGKTTTLQLLARNAGTKLIVLNMNQQSDTADLLGGYKPADLKCIIGPVRNEFETLFRKLFVLLPNNLKYLDHVSNCFNGRRWNELMLIMNKVQQKAVERLSERDPNDELNSWIELGTKIEKIQFQLKHGQTFGFKFVEGALVRALQEGYWVLLDEINLATPDTLQCLSGILEGSGISLYERGDVKPLKQHSDFRLMAAMNPATDVGKKQLPQSIRNRFTEFFVNEVTSKEDLSILISCYLPILESNKVNALAKFYLAARKQAETNLTDGIGHRPHYSLRTLCRALSVAATNKCGSIARSLYEGLCLSFLTQLDATSSTTMREFISKGILGSNKQVLLNQPMPELTPVDSHICIEGYWVTKGSQEIIVPEKYIMTDHIKMNLSDLLRIVSLSNHPTLIQGDTSVGKTSLITYLASLSGNMCLRINNHEHTDVQEYTGTYSVDAANGHMVFKEGVLVEAMRNGYWIILDELNLAPSEVLEALNRVLDDNRELYIPETQTVVKAHPNFRIFATQNPPGIYGGRKALSRAFRNRFIELHFGEIPAKELQIILQKKCELPASYAVKMVAVMKDLQIHRRDTAAFAGKQGFVTLRDLFRWGERYRLAVNTNKTSFYDWEQHIAEEGLLVLAGRVRVNAEFELVADILEKHIKRKIDLERLFTLSDDTSVVTRHILEQYTVTPVEGFEQFVWTYNMRMSVVLIGKALEFKEPVLLVGNTGCGKTSLCQLIATRLNRRLFTVNCHQHSESSDFLGGLRPVRNRAESNGILKLFEWVDGPLIESMKTGNLFLADEICLADDSVLERLNSLLEPERTLLLNEKPNSESDFGLIKADDNFLFLSTMNPGDDVGKKELSPALRNRLTEIWCESIHERDDWVAVIDKNMKRHVCFNNHIRVVSVGSVMLDFMVMMKELGHITRITYSIRDFLLWSDFMNVTEHLPLDQSFVRGALLVFIDKIGIAESITVSCDENRLNNLKIYLKRELIDKISRGEWIINGDKERSDISNDNVPDNDDRSINRRRLFETFESSVVSMKDSTVGCDPFFIERGMLEPKLNPDSYAIIGGTLENIKKLFIALQVPGKPILLEGHPGVGKTSLIENLATITGHPLVRINLSEQTDVSDLFGADLPVDGAVGGTFAWKDGPFLKALKDGSWILLDEVNLASQSVLEGLNAVLDHRGELYIPELGRAFKINSRNTRIFACQNPASSGGARKRLARSFMNRFIQVHVDKLKMADYISILRHMYPDIPVDDIKCMVKFNSMLADQPVLQAPWAGGAWELNIRDLSRWCQLIVKSSDRDLTKTVKPERFIDLVYKNRLRTVEEKKIVDDIRLVTYGIESYDIGRTKPCVHVTTNYVVIGDQMTERAGCKVDFDKNKDSFEYCDVPAITDAKNSKLVLDCQKDVLYALAACVNMNWLSIVVGPSCSGKVSVVKLFAQLCNRKLEILSMNSAMDSMDIIGGFEQVDYGRHLEEIAAKAEQCLYRLSQRLFLSNESYIIGCRTVAFLFKAWEKYKDIKKESKDGATDTYSTLSSEMNLFMRRIDALDKFLDVSMRHKIYTENLKNLKAKLSALKNEIGKNDFNNLNSGGRFEWVDSVLIKCVSEGYWLLVENANLCSPAVLDRLNGLLEPGGVLIIGEKGVDSNKNLTTIKPHRNFRLFFTMDPARGEISRAMRNRGVEMVLPMPIYTELSLDTIALLHSLGLFPYSLKRALIRFHTSMLEDCHIGDYDKIKNSHLQRAAFLISCRIRMDYPYFEAFRISCEEVYIKSRYLPADEKEKLFEYVSEMMCEEMMSDIDPVRVDINDSLTPSANTTDAWRTLRDSVYQTIRKDADPLISMMHILQAERENEESCPNFDFSLGRFFSMHNFRPFSPPRQLLRSPHPNSAVNFKLKAADALVCCLYYFYAASSLNDVALRHRWFSSILEKSDQVPKLLTSGNQNVMMNRLKVLSAVFCNYISSRSNISSITTTSTVVSPYSFSSSSVDVLLSTPQQTIVRELCWSTEVCPMTISAISDPIPAVHLLMNLVMLELTPELTYQCDDSIRSTTFRHITVQEYCRLSVTDPLRCIELNRHLVLANFPTIVGGIRTYFENVFKHPKSYVSSDVFVTFLKSLVTLKHFKNVGGLRIACLTPDKGVIVNKCALEYLDIHYYWFSKYITPPLERYAINFPDNENIVMSTMDTIAKINNSLTYQTVHVQRLIRKLHKLMHVPSLEHVNEIWLSALQIDRHWDPTLFKENDDLSVSSKVIQFFCEHHDLRNDLVTLYGRALNGECNSDIVNDVSVEKPNISVCTSAMNDFVDTSSVELRILSGIFCHRIEGRLWNDIVYDSTDSLAARVNAVLPHLTTVLTYKPPIYSALLNYHFSDNNENLMLLVELAEQLRFGTLILPLRYPAVSKPAFIYCQNYVQRLFNDMQTQNSLPMLNSSLYLMFNGNFFQRCVHSSISHMRDPPLVRTPLHAAVLKRMKNVLWRNSMIMSHSTWNYRLNEAESAKGQYCRFLSNFVSAMNSVGGDISCNVTISSFDKLQSTDIGDVVNAVRNFLAHQRSLLPKTGSALQTTLARINEQIVAVYRKLSVKIPSDSAERSWEDIAKMWIDLGLLFLDVFSFVPNYDPLNKNACKTMISTLEASRLQHMLSMGQLYANVTRNHIDPQVTEALDQSLSSWERNIPAGSKDYPVIPYNNSRRPLLLKLRDYFDENTYKWVAKLTNSLSEICNNQHPETEVQHIFKVVDTWLHSHDVFVAKVMRPEMLRNSRLIVPLMYASSLYTRGIRILRSFAQKRFFTRRAELGAIKKVLMELSSIPLQLNSIYSITDAYLTGSFKTLPTIIGPTSINVEHFNLDCHFNMVRIFLLEFNLTLSATKSSDLKVVDKNWNYLNRILDEVIRYWLKQQKLDDAKKMLEECLFIQRSGEGSTDGDETDEGEIDKLFSFNLTDDSQEDSNRAEDTAKNQQHDQGDVEMASVNGDNEDRDSVCCCGKSGSDDRKSKKQQSYSYSEGEIDVINNLCYRSAMMSPSVLWCVDPEQHFIKPSVVYKSSFIYRFSMFDTLFCHCPFLMDSDDDGHLVPALINITNIMQHRFASKVDSNYNFSMRANVFEANNLLTVLKNIEAKLNVVMSGDLEDHPLLKEISIILRRLLQFNVASPFLKFIDGSQMLLDKLEEWDQVAHSGIAFGEYRRQIGSLIIHWRKLQLSDWEKTFDYVADRVRRADSKCWFYLYNLCLSFLKSTSEISYEDLVNTLHRFMETSDLITFRQRSEMLHTFHFHFMNAEQCDRSNLLCYVLWNVHSYYSIFSNQISAYHRQLIQPLHKDLTDYVKIQRWNDKNFFAVKSTIEKTLRTFSRYIRKFEKLIKTQICVVMNRTPFAELKDTTSSLHMFAKVQDMRIYVAPLEWQNDYSMYLQEIRRLNVLHDFSKEVTSGSTYAGFLSCLDDYITNVAESMTDLDGLEINVKAPKEKQRSEAKNILQRKKKVFSDLFKQLNNIGLSYKSGLIGQNQEDYRISFANIQPVDIEEAIKLFDNSSTDPLLAEAWQGCKENFYMCIAHHLFLTKILEKPHNDIGPMYLDRMKGFSNHIMQIIFHQRNLISVNTEKFYALRAMENVLSKAPKPLYVSKYPELVKLKLSISTVIDETIYFLREFAPLLQTYPESSADLISGDDDDKLNQLALIICTDNDFLTRGQDTPEFINCVALIESCSRILVELQRHLRNGTKFDRTLYCSRIASISKKHLLRDDNTITEDQLMIMQQCRSTLLDVAAKLNRVSDRFASDNHSIKHPMFKSLNSLADKLRKVVREMDDYKNQNGPIPRRAYYPYVSSNAGDINEKILIRLQNVYKKFKSDKETNAAVSQFSEEASSAEGSCGRMDAWTNFPQFGLMDVLKEDFEVLQMDNILKKVQNLVKLDESIYGVSETSAAGFFSVLRQYTLMVEYFLTQQIHAFNVSTRLCLLLCDMFNTLGTKGFNIPEELLAEEQKNQSGSKGGMGLSNDEIGTKDVSDQIDSLDDLEDAQLPGQENKEQEEHCEEEKNGIEMTDEFDGKSFDLEKDETKDKDGNESEDDKNDDDLDKEMGELGPDAESLDPSIWDPNENNDNDDEGNDKKEMDEIDAETAGKQPDGQYGAKDEKTNESEEKPLDKDEAEDGNDKQKEINEMDDEQPVDDDQIDPYHGNQPPLPEPEPLDLPVDLRLDGADGDSDHNEDEHQEDNPLDIDAMKKQIPPDQNKPDETSPDDADKDDNSTEPMDVDKSDETEPKPDENGETPDNEQEQEAGKDELLPETNNDDEETKKPDDQKTEDGGKKDEEKIGDEPKEHDSNDDNAKPEPSRDKPSKDTAQCAQTAFSGSKDMVEDNENDKIDKNEDEMQESDVDEDDTTGAEEHGVGAAERSAKDTDEGHLGDEDKGSVNKNEQSGSSKKRKNPGETSDERTLSAPDRIAKKRLKTVDVDKPSDEESKDESKNDAEEESKDESVDESNADAGLYEHIVDSKENENTSETLDAATQDQLNQQAIPNKEDEIGEELKPDDNMELCEDEEPQETEAEQDRRNNVNQFEALDLTKPKKMDSAIDDKCDNNEDIPSMDVEGEIIKTSNVARGTDSMFNTPFEMDFDDCEQAQIDELISVTLLAQTSKILSNEEISCEDARSFWHSVSSSVDSLSHELSDQLRLILEPTQASQLKGDFRTGRRINMRKVIPYIASQFRKDKIWLRRTKPSKRTYQIILAIDNSSSMDDNHSKQLAFQSVATLSQALETIEAGQLGILSFGKTSRILHRLDEPFTTEIGVRLIQEITFKEDETCTTDMMKLAMGMFLNESNSVNSNHGEKPAQLLMIISDGRGVTSTGANALQNVIGQVRQCNIFTVFIIVENPDVQNSVYDIRQPIFEDGKLCGFEGYLEKFPFPFYMVLRDINKLPSVLSDALRQWFELVSNSVS